MVVYPMPVCLVVVIGTTAAQNIRADLLDLWKSHRIPLYARPQTASRRFSKNDGCTTIAVEKRQISLYEIESYFMKRPQSIAARRKNAASSDDAARPSGSQTLFRGLDVLEAVAGGISGLPELATSLDLHKSTTYRLAAALVERDYLRFTPGFGYTLGPKLLELGSAAHSNIDLVQIAKPILSELSAHTSDTVHLGVYDNESVLYLDKIAGGRRIVISSRVGERQPLHSTGLGKALMLDMEEAEWRTIYKSEKGPKDPKFLAQWLRRMAEYAGKGHAFDLEENEDRIRCVSAPIRDAAGSIVGAISVSSATQYMEEARMASLSADVKQAAGRISQALGWSGTQVGTRKKG